MKHKILIKPEESKKGLEKLFEAIAVLKNSAEVAAFFTDLCTPNELQAMADRWTTVNMLKAGLTYRDINEKTGISVATVTRVARCILYGENGYNLVYNRLEGKKDERKSKTQNRDTKKR